MKQMQKQSSYDVIFTNSDKDNRSNDTTKIDTMFFNNELIEATIKEIKRIIEIKNPILKPTENEITVGYCLIETCLLYSITDTGVYGFGTSTCRRILVLLPAAS